MALNPITFASLHLAKADRLRLLRTSPNSRILRCTLLCFHFLSTSWHQGIPDSTLEPFLSPQRKNKGCLPFKGKDTLYHLIPFLSPGYLEVPSKRKKETGRQSLPAASASRHPQRGQGGPKGHCGLAVHFPVLSAPAERCVSSACKSQ